MNTPESQELHRPPPSPPSPPKPLTSKLFSLFSVLVLLSAISYAIITQTNHYKISLLRSILSPHPNILQHLLNFLKTSPPTIRTPNQTPSNTASTPSHCVLWMAPFLSGGGYSSESWSYILSLHEYQKSPRFRLRIEQHGDLENIEFWEGLSVEMRNLAIQLHQTQCRLDETIVICHSEPGAWYPPLFETLPCPPIGYEYFKAVIGRTMFETDRVTADHVDRCNNMDYVWVPTEFHVETFMRSGVDPLKVVKVVQAVDVEFFDPVKYEPLDIGARGSLVLGKSNSGEKEFVFLSVFKWEHRKGWDVLLRSYLREFDKDDGVALFLLTNPYHTEKDFGNKIVEYVERSDLKEPHCGWPPIYVIDDHIAQVDIPRLYKAANAFVLPSRGEGWGRPIVEAMAMSLPVISTNWSGPTEYMTDANSYPLSVDTFSKVAEGPFKGHLWAEPSVDKLQMLMRHVMTNYEEAKTKGEQARVDMTSKFSPQLVARIVADHIHGIIDLADEDIK
ncbi:PREDICTED: uncharacterized protein LOC109147924 isoform X2 [Ipomoea nil]|uniref:uncharacterized protein LOC109147924 isoform X2 n=1 Tax=Ipomoea nil TaxID=35883 RepID=UPI0009010666|nr:PREDICTED: uncharacterized protein LOC109147924 isoform X2 [Ipomoea nil]